MSSENMLEKVTLIVPVYNVEDYLDRCMDSVLGQTYENLEIIRNKSYEYLEMALENKESTDL